MTERERKTAYAWDHIKQAGSALAKRGDSLLPGYRELKKMGVVTINGTHVRLTGDYRRAFLVGEDLPSWADLSVAVSTEQHHATKKSDERAHEHDPVGHARGVRAREIVRLAAEQVKDPSTRYWLLADERGTFEKAARKYLEETADKARALGMPNAKVNEEIAVMLALSAVEAFLKRARKGR